MSRWDDPVPPNGMARWVARHLRALQICWVLFAVADGTFIVIVWMSDGSGKAIALLPSLLSLVAVVLGLRAIARSVVRYDEHVSRRDDPMHDRA